MLETWHRCGAAASCAAFGCAAAEPDGGCQRENALLCGTEQGLLRLWSTEAPARVPDAALRRQQNWPLLHEDTIAQTSTPKYCAAHLTRCRAVGALGKL